jgi:hypothetical protein
VLSALLWALPTSVGFVALVLWLLKGKPLASDDTPLMAPLPRVAVPSAFVVRERAAALVEIDEQVARFSAALGPADGVSGELCGGRLEQDREAS